MASGLARLLTALLPALGGGDALAAVLISMPSSYSHICSSMSIHCLLLQAATLDLRMTSGLAKLLAALLPALGGGMPWLVLWRPCILNSVLAAAQSQQANALAGCDAGPAHDQWAGKAACCSAACPRGRRCVGWGCGANMHPNDDCSSLSTS